MATNDKTIISFEDIEKVRPIAQNIQDLNRVQPYILEAERLDVLPVLGASLYRQLVEADYTDVDVITINGVEVSKEDYEEILNGGYYTDCCSKEEQYQSGLISAISYLTYARGIMQNNINFTAFGVVTKKVETSEPASDLVIIRASKQAQTTGLETLRQCVEFLKCKKLIAGCNTKSLRYKRKIKAIGN